MPRKGSGVKKGTKVQVWHGSAHQTAGGLTKSDLMQNEKGKIVSRKRHEIGKALQRKYPLRRA